jgi:hypothetical protein
MNCIHLKQRLPVLFMIVLALVTLFPAVVGAETTWDGSQQIDDNTGLSTSNPQISISGPNVVAVWIQYDGDLNKIYGNYSTDRGETWHSARLISSDSLDAIHPQVAISGLDAVVVFQQSDGIDYRIYRNYSPDGGATWSGPRLIENVGMNGSRPQVAMSGLKVAAVWSQSDNFSEERVYSNFSTNGGADWGIAQPIDNDGQTGYSPRLAMSASNAVAVWFQEESGGVIIYSNYSPDGGSTWNTPQPIENKIVINNFGPSIAMSGTNVVVAWHTYDGTRNRVYTGCSTDGGMTWQDAGSIDSPGAGGEVPDVAISGTRAVAVWGQYDGNDYRIGSNYSLDAGATWHEAGLIDNPGFNGGLPQVAISGSNVVAVWAQLDAVGDGAVSNCSADGGATWEGPLPLKVFSGHIGGYIMYRPQLALYGASVVAVWDQADENNRIRIYSSRGTVSGPAVPGFSFISLTPLVLLLGLAIFWVLYRRAKIV